MVLRKIGQSMPTPAANSVFEIENVVAALAFEQLHERVNRHKSIQTLRRVVSSTWLCKGSALVRFAVTAEGSERHDPAVWDP
jgi:hypothetical protein